MNNTNKMKMVFGKINNTTNIKKKNIKLGFGKDAGFALNLLNKTINLLNENNIEYYIISGTLLGHFRNKGFIPWDDDIDLIVNSDIIDKLPTLLLNDELTFLKFDNWMIKTCLKTGINKIKHVHNDKLINATDSYYWPFVDIFIYNKTDTELEFFRRKWDRNEFEPYNLEYFYNIPVKVPKNPDYFLKINYGSDYLTKYKIYNYIHKYEKFF